MATHSSILAWRIPWTAKLGGCSPQGPTEVPKYMIDESLWPEYGIASKEQDLKQGGLLRGFVTIKVEDGGDLTQSAGGGCAEMQWDSRSVLKEGPRGFADRLGVGCQGKQWFLGFWPEWPEDGVVNKGMERDFEESKVGETSKDVGVYKCEILLVIQDAF